MTAVVAAVLSFSRVRRVLLLVGLVFAALPVGSALAQAPPSVFAGYADSFRGALTHPSPWQGSPPGPDGGFPTSITFLGCDAGPLFFGQPGCPRNHGSFVYDSGALRIDNATNATIGVSDVSVTMETSTGAPTCTYDPWPPSGFLPDGIIRFPAHGLLILTQTGNHSPCKGDGVVGDYNFDTSESNHSSTPCVNDGQRAVVTMTVHEGGTTFTQSYLDEHQTLNTGGVDPGKCGNLNEARHETGLARTTTDTWVKLTPVPAPPPPPAHIYITATGIWKASLPDGGGLNQIVTSPTARAPQGIAVAGSHIYWANQSGNGTPTDAAGSGAIMRANLDGSDPKLLFTGSPEVAVPQGVAVDSTHGHIYWVNANNGRIMEGDLHGTGTPKTLATAATGGFAIAVSSTRVYWQNGQTIWSDGLDGTDPAPAQLLAGAGNVRGIAGNSSHLYWTRFGACIGGGLVNTRIVRADLADNVPMDLIAGSPLCQPRYITLDSSHIYWADTTLGQVNSANLDGIGVTTVANVSGAVGVAVGP